MRNRRPIFLVGFSRSGSNILLNLLRSHPEVCSPRGELHQVFHGARGEPRRVRVAKRLRYLPILLTERRDVFDPHSWTPRGPLRPRSARRVDAILWAEKLRARGPGQNRDRGPGRPYTDAEVAAARLLCKNLNGTLFLSEQLAAMYPDARFFGLVRDPRALCEGRLRRGGDLAAAARRIELGLEELARQAERIPGYRLVHYEDLVAEPRRVLEEAYAHAGLDLAAVDRVRLQTKRVLTADGRHELAGGPEEKELAWVPLEELAQRVRPDANANQIGRLAPSQRAQVEELCGRSLERFGYPRGP